ncbi:hypothetical protein ABZX77_30375 [Streptomyces sp. NPDC004237]|uniref:hypothetical protein n=1 Tax=Streptomyces sp. NPDC004237 TaxID=3154455 RepID=UPI0033AFCB5F
MTNPLSTECEQSIRARANAATPGPWERYEKYSPTFYANVSGQYLQGVGDFNFGDGAEAEADEAFVRHAREDVDALLAEIDRLRRTARPEAFRAAADAIEREQAREERAERERFGSLDQDTELESIGVSSKARFLRRLADQEEREKDTSGGNLPTEGESTAAHGRVDPLTVSRFDVAMEPAPEEEPVFVVGAVADDGRPVALLFDPEARRRVAGWLGARHTRHTIESARATTPEGPSQ